MSLRGRQLIVSQDAIQDDRHRKAQYPHFARASYDNHDTYCRQPASIRTPARDAFAQAGE
jgi:hypothetical protein